MRTILQNTCLSNMRLRRGATSRCLTDASRPLCLYRGRLEDSTGSGLRIPPDVGHRFRRMPAPIPRQAGRGFRGMSAPSLLR